MHAPEVLGGRYELRGILGRGGMAEVRDAWDLRLGRPVAVKLLYPSVSEQPDTRRRFATEARAAAVVAHPHVVAVHDTGIHRGRHYIVLERLPGRSVADALARGGPMPAQHVRGVLRDVLDALGAAHARGVLHRDIKPANLLYTWFGTVKVADFGVAKSADSPQTLTNRVFGTMAYLPADRIAGRPAVPGDDLYALGVVAYEALTAPGLSPGESDRVGRCDRGRRCDTAVGAAGRPRSGAGGHRGARDVTGSSVALCDGRGDAGVSGRAGRRDERGATARGRGAGRGGGGARRAGRGHRDDHGVSCEFVLVPPPGLEPGTCGLKVRSSTD